jgi:uncharacterized protein (DUF2141 family)
MFADDPAKEMISGEKYSALTSNYLEVSVSGLQASSGNLIICLSSTGDQFLENCLDQQSIPVLGQSSCRTLFKNIPHGHYAISVFQDLNQNSILDTKTLFKIPSEPFGFSNNPHIFFGPPSFNQCKFEINAERKEIQIRLKKL